MKFLSKLLLLAGYTLVYASVANHGKFATEPWAGLFGDAYATPSTQTQKSGGSNSETSGKSTGGTVSNNPQQAVTRPSRYRKPTQGDLNSVLQQTQSGMSGG